MVEGISEEMVYLMTDRERAQVVIEECPEVWDRVCHMSQGTFEALTERLALALAEQCTREAEIYAGGIDSCRLSPLWMNHYDDLAKRTSVGNAIATLLIELDNDIRTQGETT